MKLHPVYWILAAVLTVGGAGMMIGGAAKMADERKMEVYSENTTFEVGDGYGLDIDVSVCDVVVQCDERQELCEIELENVPREVQIYEEDGVIHILHELKWTSIWTNGIVREPGGKVTVKLPAYDYDSVDLDLGAGNGEITGVDCRRLELDCGAGDTELRDCKTQESRIVCGAGECTGEDLELGDFDVNCGMGNFSLTDSKVRTLHTEVGAGNASLTDVDVSETADFSLGMGDLRTQHLCVDGRTKLQSGAGNCTMSEGKFRSDVTCEVGAGDLRMTDMALRGDLTVESAAGDVTLSLKEEADSFDVDCSGVVGDVRIAGKNTKTHTSNHAPYAVTVEGMGDVEITFKGE